MAYLGKDDASASDPSAPFEDFYRRDYRLLLKMALAVGALWDQAQEIVDQTMEDILRQWNEIRHPRAYARRAVLSHVAKQKKREQERLSRTLRGGHLVQESCQDQELTVWEDEEWVNQVLKPLSPAQREVMEYVVAGLTPSEISELLGKTPEAVRKNLQLARQHLKRRLGPDGTPRQDDFQEYTEPRPRSGRRSDELRGRDTTAG